MPATTGSQEIYGTVDLFILPGKKYSVKQNGLATYDISYWMQLIEGQSVPFQQGQVPQNGEFPDVVLLYFDIVTDGSVCGGIRIDLHYEGMADDAYTDISVSDDVTFEYQQNQDDISSHPDFLKFAGTQTNPEHGAQFDGQGKFSFFPAQYINNEESEVPNEYAGVVSYVRPNPSGRLSRIETAWPKPNEMLTIGKIADPSTYTNNLPPLPPNSVGDPGTWLYASYRGRNIANKYFDTERVFLGSGPRGWIEGIYKAPVTGPP